MNNELITNAFKGLLERLEKTEKFVLAQAPDICREMIVKANISSIFSVVFGIVLLIAGVLLATKGYGQAIAECADEYRRGCSDRTMAGTFMAIFGAIGSVVACMILYCSIHSLVERIFCPKLFLIKEFKDLLAPPSNDEE